MKKYTFLIGILLALFSCDFNKSVKKDLITGLTTKGDGLSCNDVYLTDGENKLNRTEFVYGEKFYVNFNNIKGFKREGAVAFPGMQMIVLNEKNDTVMIGEDLFENQVDGFDMDPLLLTGNLITASPIHSNKEYAILIKIWDKKGNGTFKAKLKFTVVSNDKIVVEESNLKYGEIYVYSQEQDKIITNNELTMNETFYMVFEGLNGFSVEDGIVKFGLKVRAKDSQGNVLIDERDLAGETGYNYAKIAESLPVDLIFTGETINNPVSCEFLVWDKNSENKITVTTELNLK